jgi:hypothetical protein
MKKISLMLGLALASLSHLSAQVVVRVVFTEDQFLPGESIPVAAQVVNRSGQPLKLGSQDDWLTFSVESRDGFVVNKSSEVPVKEPFTLQSAERATRHVDLAPYFTLSKPGRYSVIATVNIPQWGQQISSDPVSFNVIEGSLLWEQEFGVPKKGGNGDDPPEVRKYILQQANYLHSRLRLYLRVTDAGGGQTFKVYPIGPMVSFSSPEPQLDRLSQLHVLYQDGPHTYSYTVFNPNGELLKRHSYTFTVRPRLAPDHEGNLSVAGGIRFPRADDVPPSTVSTNNVTPDQP